MSLKVGDKVRIVGINDSDKKFSGRDNPSFVNTLNKVGEITSTGFYSTKVKFETGQCFYYVESDLALIGDEKKVSEEMLVIPGFKNYSWDPATKRVWSNLSKKWISLHPKTADVYYLKSDNAHFNRWSKKYDRTRITVAEIMKKIGVAVKTAVVDTKEVVDTKTRGEFIVLKRNVVDGTMTMVSTPKVYNSWEAAREAATTMAKMNKGIKFSVLEVKGTAVSSDVVWS